MKTKEIKAPKSIKITNWVVVSKFNADAFEVFASRNAARDFRDDAAVRNDWMAPKKYTGTIRLVKAAISNSL